MFFVATVADFFYDNIKQGKKCCWNVMWSITIQNTSVQFSKQVVTNKNSKNEKTFQDPQ